jgi:hypothetical protein
MQPAVSPCREGVKKPFRRAVLLKLRHLDWKSASLDAVRGALHPVEGAPDEPEGAPDAVRGTMFPEREGIFVEVSPLESLLWDT